MKKKDNAYGFKIKDVILRKDITPEIAGMIWSSIESLKAGLQNLSSRSFHEAVLFIAQTEYFNNMNKADLLTETLIKCGVEVGG
jgi:hypothetical protein